MDCMQNESTSCLFVACCLLCGVLLVLALGLFVLILVVVPVGVFFSWWSAFFLDFAVFVNYVFKKAEVTEDRI